MTLDPPSEAPQSLEQEIEKLAQEIGRRIQAAKPERREDLKELAFTLIREEIFQRPDIGESAQEAAPGPFNPLGTGVILILLGAGLSFVFGPVGLFLMFGGLLFVVWGMLISWFKKAKG